MTRHILRILPSDRRSHDKGVDNLLFFPNNPGISLSPLRRIYPPSLSVTGPLGGLWFIALDFTFHSGVERRSGDFCASAVHQSDRQEGHKSSLSELCFITWSLQNFGNILSTLSNQCSIWWIMGCVKSKCNKPSQNPRTVEKADSEPGTKRDEKAVLVQLEAGVAAQDPARVDPVLLDYAQRLSEEIVTRAVQQWAEVDSRYSDIPYIECDVP
ncbi:Small membrane A-kinase anchor protein [Bagarius yarrelli]|uniref:Small membrane A-kinase anchor protein n=1 Tax=Bagarius yarrelli TaxID=175774 RepID=A0A556V6B4_BAGYA|nr:Small membrane A-kinase anchor protein [Bagarius yarrelli]